MAVDALYWDTALILNFEDSGTTTFTDISPNALTPETVGGGAVNSATQAKTGSKSLALDGTTDYLRYSDNTDFQFGTGDFCVEFWFRPTTIPPVTEDWLITYSNTALAVGGDFGWLVRLMTTGKLRAGFYNGATEYASVGVTTLTAERWYHVAYVRLSGTVKLYLDGAAEDTDTHTPSLNVPTGTPYLTIGASPTGTVSTEGYIDGVRITKGHARYTADFSLTLPTDLFEATAPVTSDTEFTMPMPTVFVGGGAAIEPTMPMPTVEFREGMEVAVAAPMPQFDITGHDATGERAVEIAMPMPTVDMRLGMRAAIAAPMPTMDSGATTTILFDIEISAPMPTLAMVVTTTGSVSVQASAPMPAVAMRGGNNMVAVAPMASLDMEATTGSVLSITATVPMAEVAATLSSGGTMSLAITAPMPVAGPWGRIVAVAPMAQVTVVASSVVTVTYEAYAVNLQPGDKMPHQVTRYTNFPFNQIVRWQDNYYGVADDGLYLLGGDTDYDAVTPTGPPWTFDTGITDFKSSRMKGVREAVIGGRIGPAVTASVSVGEAADQTYAATIVRGQTAQNHRIKYGRGLKGRYWSFGLADAAGGACDVDSIEFDATELTRKI